MNLKDIYKLNKCLHYKQENFFKQYWFLFSYLSLLNFLPFTCCSRYYCEYRIEKEWALFHSWPQWDCFSFPSFRMTLTVCFSHVVFKVLMYVSSCPTLSRTVIMKLHRIFEKWLICIYWENHVIFLLLYEWYHSKFALPWVHLLI